MYIHTHRYYKVITLLMVPVSTTLLIQIQALSIQNFSVLTEMVRIKSFSMSPQTNPLSNYGPETEGLTYSVGIRLLWG